MKIGIVGSGLVGATAAYALVMRGVGREIVLVDLDAERARAEADDIQHAVPFANPLRIQAGDYAQLKGAKLVVIAAGVSQREGETRLELLGRNAEVFRSVVPSILEHAPDAILLVATNPVDIMTHVAASIAAEHDVSPGRVMGTGTTLDTARFRTLLATQLEVDSPHVHAYVLGEHGDSEVLAWSLVTVGGLPLDEYCSERGLSVCADDRDRIDDAVRNAAYRIIEGKGATYYGIGSAIARIARVVLGDQRAILTLTAPVADVAGVEHVSLSLPRVVGGSGIVDTLMPPLERDEHEALEASARTIRDATDELGL